jgi:hypothetical protein
MRKYSLQISVTLVILIVLFILYGCGTRKTDLQVKDSIHIENNYSQGTKIVLGNTFTYKPFDSLKPMVIDNVVYKNVIITNDKTNTVTKWKDRNITKTIVTEKKKQTEKSDNTILWIFIAFIIFTFIFLWFYLPKLKI